MARRSGMQRSRTTTKPPHRSTVSAIAPYALPVLDWKRQIARVFERLPLILSAIETRESRTTAPQQRQPKMGRVIDIRVARIARDKRRHIPFETK